MNRDPRDHEEWGPRAGERWICGSGQSRSGQFGTILQGCGTTRNSHYLASDSWRGRATDAHIKTPPPISDLGLASALRASQLRAPNLLLNHGPSEPRYIRHCCHVCAADATSR